MRRPKKAFIHERAVKLRSHDIKLAIPWQAPLSFQSSEFHS